jgi:hypothetical protein
MRTPTPQTPTTESSSRQSHLGSAPSPTRSRVPVAAASVPSGKPQAALAAAMKANQVLMAAATHNNLLASQSDAAPTQAGDLL